MNGYAGVACNGHHNERVLLTELGPVPVRVPRVWG